MSGIFGIFNLTGMPAAKTDLNRMAALLKRRGPDGTGFWHAGPIGLGHTLLITTPESAHEPLPLVHDASGCVITGDARLDNRDELLAALAMPLTGEDQVGEGRLILEAYLKWGEACVNRFLGDFVFAIWDPRRQTLFCGRDHFGMRAFYYHYSPNRFLVFASEPRAIMVLRQVPYRINEKRIADFLVNHLEGIDKTSTFFENIFRMPPSHAMTVTPEGMQQQRYWTLTPGPELRLSSDEDYVEAFLDVFSKAVRCRLRGVVPVGSMLSGGMDSGSVAAMARRILADTGQGPLPTFSAVGPDPGTCVETRTIQGALTMDGLEPHIVNYAQLDNLMPTLEDLTWNPDEPFDNHMTLPRAVYLSAHRRGIKVLLDGVGGDIVLGEGSYISRLWRTGHWRTAYREAVGENRFWGVHCPTWRVLIKGLRTTLVPESLRRLKRQSQRQKRQNQQLTHETIRNSMVRPDFARRIRLDNRILAMNAHRPTEKRPISYAWERAYAIDHPYLTAGRERYDRVASAVAVEPRDPFLDLRVIDLCLSLPGSQKMNNGWPKAILRRAMNGWLPDAVRWRRGKEHLGWDFTSVIMARKKPHIPVNIEKKWPMLFHYVDLDMAQKLCHDYTCNSNSAEAGRVYDMMHLAMWLDRHARSSSTERFDSKVVYCSFSNS